MGSVKAYPYSNKRNETVYFYTSNDSKSQSLVGKSLYEITFAKGQLPPVKGFWSLTVYNPEHLFYANALNRFALGTKNKTLKYNGDGSLTFIEHTVTTGVPKPKSHPAPMPPMGGASLSPDQIKAVAAYVYSLSHKS